MESWRLNMPKAFSFMTLTLVVGKTSISDAGLEVHVRPASEIEV
jgi:hypothetical protein